MVHCAARIASASLALLLAGASPSCVAQQPGSCDRGAQPSMGRQATELQPLSPGVTLPIRLEKTLRAGSSRPGTTFVAKTTQRVPIAPGIYLPRNLQVLGTVVASQHGSAGVPATLTLRFTAVRLGSTIEPVSLEALALANFLEVARTGDPASGPVDRANPSSSDWTTQQVGGDEVYRSDWTGPVCDSVMHKVGEADFFGVYAAPGFRIGGVALPFPRALGVFSAGAHGVYGDPAVHLASAAGTVTFSAAGRSLSLPGEDNLLLQVTSASQPSSHD